MTITHDALDLTIQEPLPPALAATFVQKPLGLSILYRVPSPKISDIEWSRPETCSNLFLEDPIPSADTWWLGTEAHK